MQQRVRLAATPDRHDERVGDESRRHLGLIDQPTTQRDNSSITAATESQPSAVQTSKQPVNAIVESQSAMLVATARPLR
jgi:hypothetical protein